MVSSMSPPSGMPFHSLVVSLVCPLSFYYHCAHKDLPVNPCVFFSLGPALLELHPKRVTDHGPLSVFSMHACMPSLGCHFQWAGNTAALLLQLQCAQT
jgi:hypothetical protein